MKTTLKTLTAIFLVFTASTFAFATEENSKITVSPELRVKITALDQTNVAVMFNKIEGETVKIKIYDEKGALIYSEKEVNGTSYAKKFNLSSVDSKKYTYKVSNDVYSVSKIIELK